jgi:hypothetical protein
MQHRSKEGIEPRWLRMEIPQRPQKVVTEQFRVGVLKVMAQRVFVELHARPSGSDARGDEHHEQSSDNRTVALQEPRSSAHCRYLSSECADDPSVSPRLALSPG